MPGEGGIACSYHTQPPSCLTWGRGCSWSLHRPSPGERKAEDYPNGTKSALQIWQIKATSLPQSPWEWVRVMQNSTRGHISIHLDVLEWPGRISPWGTRLGANIKKPPGLCSHRCRNQSTKCSLGSSALSPHLEGESNPKLYASELPLLYHCSSPLPALP